MSKANKAIAKETLISVLDNLSDENVFELLDFAEFLLSKSPIQTRTEQKRDKNPILELIGIANVEPFANEIDKELYGEI